MTNHRLRTGGILGVVLAVAILAAAWLARTASPPAPAPSPASRPERERPRWPRFDRHRRACPQCRGDTPNEFEGGPPPLCEEGFRIMREDMQAEAGG